MRLEQLEIAGFFHFDRPVALDLRDLSGLVAIVGPNGHGKTRLLDAGLAGLYGPGATNRAFPSRDGTLASYATSRSASITTMWLVAGVGQFRTRVAVDGTRRLTEAVLEQILPDGRRVALNDGKVTTFREAVAARFPSLRSVLASAFAAQNRRGSFAELGQKERLELFVELADLAYLESYAATARERAAVALARRDQQGAVLAALRETNRESAVGIRASIATLVRDEEEIVAAREAAVNRLTAADAVLAACQADAERGRLARAQLESAAAELARCREDAARLAQDRPEDHYQATLMAIEDRLATARQEAQACRLALTSRAATERAARQTRRQAAEALVARDAEVTGAEAEIAVIAERRQAAQARREEAETERDRARARLTEIQRQCDQRDDLRRRVSDLRRRTALLEDVKFGEVCGTDPICPLVADAVEARTVLDDLMARAATAERRDLETAQAEAERAYRRASEARTAADQDLVSLADAERAARRLASARPQIAAARAQLTELAAADQAAAETLALDLARSDEEMQRAEARAREERQAADQALTQAHARNVARQTEIDERLGHAQARYDAAARDVAARSEVAMRLEAATADRRIQQAEIERLGERLGAVRADRVAAQARLAEYEAWEQRVDALRRDQRETEIDLAAWQVLARALGRDGLQRLEIDAAGPIVSDLADQLLSVGYGPRFGVRFVTQVATADRLDVKERFTVEVLDHLHGGDPRDLTDLSGGERVVVEEAIRAALACYVNLRSRQPCWTLWRDETTGALSPENVGPYVAMLRKLRELSGAETILFVTHSEEAAALADVVVRVQDGMIAEIARAA
jgi:exonuclease SbcC